MKRTIEIVRVRRLDDLLPGRRGDACVARADAPDGEELGFVRTYMAARLATRARRASPLQS
jgi:hypothetical protein